MIWADPGTYANHNPGLTLMNGTTDCATLICLGPDATVDSSGAITGANFIDSALTPGTSPICPNGTGGAFTTTGCSGGGGGISGSGTTGYIPAWTGSAALGNSHIDDGVATAGATTVNEVLNVSQTATPPISGLQAGINLIKGWSGSAGGYDNVGVNFLDTGASAIGNISAETADYPGYGLYRTSSIAMTGSGAGGLEFITAAGPPIDFSANGYASTTPNIHLPGGTNNVVFGGVAGWSTSGGSPDTGLSRISPGVVGVGNGTAGDTSGAINATLYQGPATAPSGSCSAIGWEFTQDGHATFCNGSTWVTKI
jgi:hypothetical protein